MKVSKRSLRPWMRKHPLLGRLSALLLLPFIPLIHIVWATYERRKDILHDVVMGWKVAFTKWEE